VDFSEALDAVPVDLKRRVLSGDVKVSQSVLDEVVALPKAQQRKVAAAVKNGGKLKDAVASVVEKCPNCGSTKWTFDTDGHESCAKCRHPKGEPVGDPEEVSVDEQVKKLKHAAQQHVHKVSGFVGDLWLLRKLPESRHVCVGLCNRLLKELEKW
jgi:uncharacterized Zn finger protein (UPF0148 family)